MFLHAAKAVRAAAGRRPVALPATFRPTNNLLIPFTRPHSVQQAPTFRTTSSPSSPLLTTAQQQGRHWRLSSTKDSKLVSTHSRLGYSTGARSSWRATSDVKEIASSTRTSLRTAAHPMLATTRISSSSSNSSMMMMNKMTININNMRAFHSSRPSQMAAPLLPVIFSVLKTPMTAAVLRILSRISLTLLPLSTRRSPRVILTLVMIPPICFGLVIAAGLEAAPNTGRWRFLFTSEESEFVMIREELPALLATMRIVEDEQDPRVQLVHHILTNLLKHAIEPDGSTLRSFNIQDDQHKDAVLAQLAEDGDEGNASLLTKTYAYHSEQNAFVNSLGNHRHHHGNKANKASAAGASTKNLQVQVQGGPVSQRKGVLEVLDDPDLAFEDRPFQIFVTEDDEINACSVGPPRLIFINSGLMEFVDNNEDMLAAVIAHEVAHVIQRHTMETHGRETVMLFLADLLRSALWTVSIPLGPWFNSWIDQTTESLLHFTASGPLHQAIEVEADTVSLSMMAMAGYDPMYAVLFWEAMSEIEREQMEREDSVEVHKWTDWMYDHPPSAERAKYMKEHVVVARDLWEKVRQMRHDEPVARFGAVSLQEVSDKGNAGATATAVAGIKEPEVFDDNGKGGWFSTVRGWFSSANPELSTVQQT